jgi:excisionase family DNA binding protein
MKDSNLRALPLSLVAPRNDATAADPSMETAAANLVDAFRAILRATLREEIASLREVLGSGSEVPRTESTSGTGETRLLSVGEVAIRLGATPATVREWIKEGYLPAVALGPAGRKYGLRWADVEASLEQRRVGARPADTDAAAREIVAAARVRASRRRGA